MSRSSNQRSAAVAVEMAFVLPLALLFLLGIFEYGRFITLRQLLTHATREGARFAVVNTATASTADVQLAVERAMSGLQNQITDYNRATSIRVFHANQAGQPVNADEVVVPAWTSAPFTDAQFGEPIVVRVTGTYRPIVPRLMAFDGGELRIMQTTATVTVTCTMYSEAN